MYLISDDYGNDEEIVNYKKLREILIEELVRDTRENIDDSGIINDNITELEKLAKSDSFDEEYIIKSLITYGYRVQNIGKILTSINKIREYYARTNSDLKAFDEVMDILERLR